MELPKPAIDHEVIDAVGELTNIICGGVKANLLNPWAFEKGGW